VGLQEKFEAFHLANPHVYEELLDRALALKNAGVQYGSIAQLFEVLRYDYALRTHDEEFKLNNSHRAFYARLLMAACPALSGFFQVRSQEDEYRPDLVALGLAQKKPVRGARKTHRHIRP
jgi:hypothetical protein